jgi:hypothetical protein
MGTRNSNAWNRCLHTNTIERVVTRMEILILFSRRLDNAYRDNGGTNSGKFHTKMDNYGGNKIHKIRKKCAKLNKEFKKNCNATPKKNKKMQKNKLINKRNGLNESI